LRGQYDVGMEVCHEQARSPCKTVAYDGSVNVTLGLP